MIAAVVCLIDTENYESQPAFLEGKLFAETNRMFFFDRKVENDRST